MPTSCRCSSTAAGHYFGVAIASGDLNGDGIDDLLVGADHYDTSKGKLYLFQGSTNGITAENTASADSTLAKDTASRYFGQSLAIGMISGDAYADLMVGASKNVFLYLGSSSGIDESSEGNLQGITTGYGASVALADMDGDATADLLIGDTSHNGYTGRVYFSFSSSSATDVSADGEAETSYFSDVIF